MNHLSRTRLCVLALALPLGAFGQRVAITLDAVAGTASGGAVKGCGLAETPGFSQPWFGQFAAGRIWFPMIDFSVGAQRTINIGPTASSAASQLDYLPLAIDRVIDACTPLLLRELNRSTPRLGAIVVSGAQNVPVFLVRFEALLTSDQISVSANDGLAESLTVQVTKISYTYANTDSTGVVTTDCAGWDLLKRTVWSDGCQGATPLGAAAPFDDSTTDVPVAVRNFLVDRSTRVK